MSNPKTTNSSIDLEVQEAFRDPRNLPSYQQRLNRAESNQQSPKTEFSNNVNIIRNTNQNTSIAISTPVSNSVNSNKPFAPTVAKVVNNPVIANRSMSTGGSLNTRINNSINTNSPSKSLNTNTRKEEFQLYYDKCMRGISHSINIIKAVMMRLVFSLHSLIAIVYVYLVKQDEWYFVNFIGVIFLLIELFITIIRRKGKEPRWFFPCFFIYICTMIPPIWFVELTRIDQANAKRRANSTALNPIESLLGLSEHLGLNEESILSNAKNLQQLDIATIAVSLEISLLMLVILGRWFLPKGNISRSTLSQLLLVYMSLASDIVDLLSLLNETQVQESSTMSYFTLTIFSWSLFQFSLNLVVTRGRSFQSVAIDDLDEDEEYNQDDETGSKSFAEKLNSFAINTKNSLNLNTLKKKNMFCISTSCFRIDLLDSEIWSILITLIFQDGPFLALRLTAVVKFDFYRLSAICTEASHNQTDALASNKADAISSLNSAASYLDKFVLLSYAQNMLIKSDKNSSKNSQQMLDDSEKKLLTISPILLRSTLSRNHSYAVVLTPNYNLNVSCCDCDCHPKENTNV